ncbi:MAG: hypothetical protein LBU86_04995 [Oscillospiraceae bacterium]|nr:hypothetical protein [Oscillospiraceae bacterium]
MSNFNIDAVKKNMLLKMAGRQLGKDPGELREKLDSGNIQELVDGLDPSAKEKVNAMLQNPQALSALLGNEQVQNLIKNLRGE